MNFQIGKRKKIKSMVSEVMAIRQEDIPKACLSSVLTGCAIASTFIFSQEMPPEVPYVYEEPVYAYVEPVKENIASNMSVIFPRLHLSSYNSYMGSAQGKSFVSEKYSAPIERLSIAREKIMTVLSEMDTDKYTVALFGKKDNSLFADQILAHLVIESTCGLLSVQDNQRDTTPQGLGQVKPNTFLGLLDEHNSLGELENMISLGFSKESGESITDGVEQKNAEYFLKNFQKFKNGMLTEKGMLRFSKNMLAIDEINIYATALNLIDAYGVIMVKGSRADTYTRPVSKAYVNKDIEIITRVAMYYHGGESLNKITHYSKKFSSVILSINSEKDKLSTL